MNEAITRLDRQRCLYRGVLIRLQSHIHHGYFGRYRADYVKSDARYFPISAEASSFSQMKARIDEILDAAQSQ